MSMHEGLHGWHIAAAKVQQASGSMPFQQRSQCTLWRLWRVGYNQAWILIVRRSGARSAVARLARRKD
jgi:hypothetical protein